MDDLISRKAAIDAIMGQPPEPHYPSWYAEQIKALPSAQPEKQHGRIFQEIVVKYPSYNPYPERKGKPYFSIKYTENGQEFIGYGTYKPEVLSEYLKEYFMPSAQPEQRWIPCSERLPKTYGAYLVQDVCGTIFVDYWRGYWLAKTTMVAWMPLPELYRGGDE